MMLGCDVVTAASFDALSKIAPGESRAIINSHETITGDFTRDPDLKFPGEELHQTITKVVGGDRTEFLEATKLATALLGNSIASNMFSSAAPGRMVSSRSPLKLFSKRSN